MHKSACFLLLLIALTTTQVIKLPTISQTTIKPILINILPRTQTAYIYHGTVDIQITQGDQQNLDFYVQFVPQTTCNWTNCFTGWVLNYTQKGDATVLGYPDGKLDVQPIFKFNTNSEEDFQIVRSHKLGQVWAQIIQIACEKLNPQLIQSSSLRKTPLDLTLKSSTETVPPKYIFKDPTLDVRTFAYTTQKAIPDTFYSFSTNSNFKLLAAQKGDLLFTQSKLLNLEDFSVKSSSLGEQIILNEKLLVKQRLITYDLALKSDNGNTQEGLIAPQFAGKILIGLNLAKTTTVLSSVVNNAKSLFESLNLADDKFKSQDIETRRLDFGYNFASEDQILLADSDDVDVQQKFENQVLSEVDVVKIWNNGGLSQPLATIDKTLIQDTISSPRVLQLLATYTIYNYNKVLYSKTILGKSFKIYVQVKCYLKVYPNVHHVQCIGKMKYQLFSKTKTITIFNFVKSVNYNWSYSKQFKGNWGFSVYVPLPPPVSFIGINFSFNIAYVIDLSLSCKNYGGYPYKIQVKAIASTAITTSASAAVRVIVIQGGVFISGTLVKLKTDPSIALAYYWNVAKKINITTKWYLQINAFQYQWGFFYRVWKFWSGWSGKKIIKKWTIKGLYAKYTLVNKSWNIYY